MINPEVMGLKYRKFCALDDEVSALGFGAMRLPTEGEDSSQIKEEGAIEMMRTALDGGVNYVDTAWPYHGEESEPLVGKTLEEGYREKVNLATKMPSWKLEEEEDLDHYFHEQLERLNVEKIDFYLLHGLNRDRWETYRDLNVRDWLDKEEDQGEIVNAGFSFHDDLEIFKEIVDSYRWDFCQIQYNYLDKDYQAGQEGLRYASEKGLGVVIMEPLMGGKLAAEPPEEIKEIWKEGGIEDLNPVKWAFYWLWNQPEVSVVLSGMSTLSQVEENLQLADDFSRDKIEERQIKALERSGEKYRELSPVECTGCNYCMPCPNDLYIPTLFRLYNDAEVYGRFEENKETYYSDRLEKKASDCKACGQCLESCPQNLPIIELMEETAEYFGPAPN